MIMIPAKAMINAL